MEYYYCRVGNCIYYFEPAGETTGVPNKFLEFGPANRLCFIPDKGSVFITTIDMGGNLTDLREVDKSMYNLSNFIFPVDECFLVTKAHRFYAELSEGFGI